MKEFVWVTSSRMLRSAYFYRKYGRYRNKRSSIVAHNLIKCKHGVSGVHKLTCKTVLELCVCNVTWECARALGLSLALMHRKELRSALLSACLPASCTSRQLISTTNRGHCVMLAVIYYDVDTYLIYYIFHFLHMKRKSSLVKLFCPVTIYKFIKINIIC